MHPGKRSDTGQKWAGLARAGDQTGKWQEDRAGLAGRTREPGATPKVPARPAHGGVVCGGVEAKPWVPPLLSYDRVNS